MNILAASSLIVSILTAVGAQPAHAAPLLNDTGLANAAATLGFDDVATSSNSASYTPLTDQYAGSYGVTFSGFYGTKDYAFNGAPAPDIVNFSGNNQPQNRTVTLVFSTAQTDIAFYLLTSGLATETITSSLGGTVVETVSGYSAGDGGYVGFTGSQFDTVTIAYESGAAPRDGSIVLDNLQFGQAIPEPSPTGFIMLGLVGAMIAHGRHRRRV